MGRKRQVGEADSAPMSKKLKPSDQTPKQKGDEPESIMPTKKIESSDQPIAPGTAIALTLMSHSSVSANQPTVSGNSLTDANSKKAAGKTRVPTGKSNVKPAAASIDKSSKNPKNEDNKNWDEIEFIIHTRDNNLPNPFGPRSSTTGPLPWEEVARRYNAHFGKTAKTLVRWPACEKRYRVNIEEYRLRRPDYPARSDIIYASKRSKTKGGSQKTSQIVAYGQGSTSRSSGHSSQLAIQADKNGGLTQAVFQTGIAITETQASHGTISYKAPKKRVGPFAEESKGIGHPDFYLEYGGPVTKEDYEKWCIIEILSSNGLRCGSVHVPLSELRANSDVIEAELRHDRIVGVTLESQGFSKSTLELFMQCLSATVEKDTLLDCLPVCKTWQELVKHAPSQPTSRIPCISDCSQNIARYAHIPSNTAREDFPPYLRSPFQNITLPEYHYTLVRQRQKDGSSALVPIVRRMDWTMDELIDLYLVATQFESRHVRAMVRFRWELIMDGILPPQEVGLESLNRFFSQPDVESSVKKLIAHGIHEQGLTDSILNSGEQLNETLKAMLHDLQNGRLVCVRLRSAHANLATVLGQKETDFKGTSTRLLHAARHNYPEAYNQLISQYMSGIKKGLSESLMDVKGSDQLAEELQNQQRDLETGRAKTSVSYGAWEIFGDIEPDNELRNGSSGMQSDDCFTVRDSEDDEDWGDEVDLWCADSVDDFNY
ncbi:uncharacterized protein EI97DRAFT_457903 [Westerdykella ornata]|uniref:Uncharacterized protein n=1 Tax=Westerdykella ornata TaxID=318751 RepID=A0A6A6JLT5_WESOR|nr:uncharacterized protein EI97DRAFT_457903 [Westerdykella ornata]KAF2277195.1 hypothetical protein EI97DRAFT_457903 [Westerdykella ornata]